MKLLKENSDWKIHIETATAHFYNTMTPNRDCNIIPPLDSSISHLEGNTALRDFKGIVVHYTLSRILLTFHVDCINIWF
jgi:hypothetical protein